MFSLANLDIHVWDPEEAAKVLGLLTYAGGDASR